MKLKDLKEQADTVIKKIPETAEAEVFFIIHDGKRWSSPMPLEGLSFPPVDVDSAAVITQPNRIILGYRK